MDWYLHGKCYFLAIGRWQTLDDTTNVLVVLNFHCELGHLRCYKHYSFGVSLIVFFRWWVVWDSFRDIQKMFWGYRMWHTNLSKLLFQIPGRSKSNRFCWTYVSLLPPLPYSRSFYHWKLSQHKSLVNYWIHYNKHNVLQKWHSFTSILF